MAKIVAFSNQKGGVGKTTACVNLAAYLAEKGKRVLIVDLDSQANATSSLGYFDKKLQNSIFSMLFEGAPLKSCIRNTDIKGLSLLPSSSDLAGAEIELGRIERNREYVLKARLDAGRDDYDYIFIDCAPSLGLLAVNALTAANGIVIPLVCEYFALEGLAQMLNTVRLAKKHLNPSLEIYGVVLTAYDGRNRLAREVKAEIDKLFGDKVFKTAIPKNVRLAEAPSYGKPIVLYDKKCAGAVAYDALAEEFIQKI
ncbi:MAG: ParA family protein [Clostridia bacterium]|nr:ParA family protein [Clostridia bacterium]